MAHIHEVKDSNRSSVRVIKQRVLGSEICPPEEDSLAIEDPLNLYLSQDDHSGCLGKPLVLTMRTPGDDVAMIHGFLFTEGIIQSAADVLDIQFGRSNPDAAPTRAEIRLRPGLTFLEDKSERHFAMHSSCGVCGKASGEELSLPGALRFEDSLTIPAQSIHTLPEKMRAKQATFESTGGLHAAALFDALGELLHSSEDIGRHNALDKAIGRHLLETSAHTPAILCVSGRMSYEILQKALVARVPIIAGVGAPSSLAVSLANDFNVTLIGFVRDGTYNIYSAPQRLRA
ncbi:MAG: formate dehydrogenase accessory sulfurtransferase FdhD [Opitutales bacterium]